VQEDDVIDICGLKDFAPGKQLTMVLHHKDGKTDKVKLNHTTINSRSNGLNPAAHSTSSANSSPQCNQSHGYKKKRNLMVPLFC
jgi:hypothetical protein